MRLRQGRYRPVAFIEIAFMPAGFYIAFLVFYFGRVPREDG